MVDLTVCPLRSRRSTLADGKPSSPSSTAPRTPPPPGLKSRKTTPLISPGPATRAVGAGLADLGTWAGDRPTTPRATTEPAAVGCAALIPFPRGTTPSDGVAPA